MIKPTIYRRRKWRMSKFSLAVTAVSVVLLIAVGAGFLYNFIIDRYDRFIHPLGYSEYVEGYSALYKVPIEIVYAVIKTESSFNKDALSPKGAMGLMQITPDTFMWLMTKTGESHELDTLYMPHINIKYGVFFLSYLYNEFGSWETTYAAYNAGMSRIKGWLADPQITEEGRLVHIPFKETKNYVRLIQRASENYRRLYKIE